MKKIYIISATIFLFIFIIFFSPIPIKSYVESHYPVKVSQVSIGLGKVYFHDVKYKSFANFNLITVPISGPILIAGGNAKLDSDIKTASAAKKTVKRRIIASKLNVSINYYSNHLDIQNVSLDTKDGVIKFGSGLFNVKDIDAELIDGNYDLNTSVVTIKIINAEVKIPRQLNKFDISNILLLRNASISIKDKSVYIGDLNAKSIVAKNLLVSMDKDGPFLAASSISIDHPLFAKGPAEFKTIVIRPLLSEPPVPIMAPEFDFKRFTITLDGGAQLILETSPMRLLGVGNCNQWVNAIPAKPNALKVADGSFSGNFNFTVALDPPKIDIKNTCEFKCSSCPIKDLYSLNGFKYTAYDKNNKPFERLVGLTVDMRFVDFHDISPNLITAIVSLEDPAFYSHKGFLPYSFQLSMMDNLKSGKFKRGGSTLTMQLAKNLWLTRDKTLLRKVDEVLLATALESCLTKDQILEYYLNVVEFGPDVYGIADGAKYYFKKDPLNLTRDEAYYLALLLPHPKKSVLPEQGGLEMARNFAMKHVMNLMENEE